MPVLDQEIVNPYENYIEFASAMAQDKDLRWKGYKDSVDHAKALEPHVFGTLPEELLTIARPNEPDEIKTYRKTVWQAVTKTRFEKIYTVFKRIFTPHNYNIVFKDRPTGVIQGAEPDKYFTSGFTDAGSVLNYMKDVLFRMSFGDPGAVVAMFDVLPDKPGEYSKPMPILYEAERVWQYSQDLIVVEAYDKSVLKSGNTEVKEGLILLFFTESETIEISQYGEKQNYTFSATIRETRETPFMPARMLKGVSTVSEDGTIWQQSFVSGIIPDWNKAITLITDLDGYSVVHLYPKYAQLTMPCAVCSGSGQEIIDSRGGEKGTCHACKGTKIQMGGTGPFASLQIPRDQIGKISINDVAGYIAPPANIIETVMLMIDGHIDAGFRALNMEVVGITQSNTSAEKVALDRQDLNQTLTDVMVWAFDFLQWLYFTAGSIRYGKIVTDIQKDVVPEISRPVSFDYSTVDSVLNEIKAGKDAELPPTIMSELHRRSIPILWGNDSEKTRRMLAAMELDPLPGITPDGILALQSTSTTEPIDFFIHYRVAELVDLAIEENPKFLDLKVSEKRNAITAIAKLKMSKAPAIPDPELIIE